MSAPLETLRGAFEATGSPSWVMRVIQEQGFDRRHGFRLTLVQSGDKGSRAAQATMGALAAGEADMIDTDWIAIARSGLRPLSPCHSAERGEGMLLDPKAAEKQPGEKEGQDAAVCLAPVFPYGRIMGGAVTAARSKVETLADLPGCRVGVIRATDKNWIVIRAAYAEKHGADLHGQTIVKEALSKTTLGQWLKTGEVDVAILPWHLVPRFQALGFRQLFDVLDLVEDLGAGKVATSFFAVPAKFAATHRATLAGFVAAYTDAVHLMRADEDVWRAAAAQPGDCTEMLAHLRASWLRRIRCEWEADAGDRLARLFNVLKKSGGAEALGSDEMPRGIFDRAFI